MLNEPTLEKLNALRLAAMAGAWTEQTKNPRMADLSFDERFGMLVDAEHLARDNRRLERLLKDAQPRPTNSLQWPWPSASCARLSAVAATELERLHEVAFPLLVMRRQRAEDHRNLVGNAQEQGTAFLISRTGFFLTARHVTDGFGADQLSILAVNMKRRTRDWVAVQAIEQHPTFDVTIGIAASTNETGWPRRLPLASSRLGTRAAVIAYGFAETEVHEFEQPGNPALGLGLRYWPKRYFGRISEYFPNGVTLSKGPSYVHTADTLRGISGGPLLRKRTGAVHGVQCCGESGYGVATDVGGIVDSWKIDLLGGQTLREHSRHHGEIEVR